MKPFYDLLKSGWKIILSSILLFGAAASLKGASIESKMSVGITADDLELAADKNVAAKPDFVGILPLAAEQNLFISYRWAVLGMAVGAGIGMAVLLILQCMHSLPSAGEK